MTSNLQCNLLADRANRLPMNEKTPGSVPVPVSSHQHYRMLEMGSLSQTGLGGTLLVTLKNFAAMKIEILFGGNKSLRLRKRLTLVGFEHLIENQNGHLSLQSF